ncbi:geranylgeranyl reductase protein, partial [Marine Group I thaumarchaeote SCGC AAA799-E16]
MEKSLERNTAIQNPKLSQDPEDINNNSGIFQVSVRRQ